MVYKLTMNRETVQEKVGVFMGGKVLDLPEIRIYHQGKAEGRVEGRAEGRAEEQINTERERKRADEAEERARKAEQRVAELEAKGHNKN